MQSLFVSAFSIFLCCRTEQHSLPVSSTDSGTIYIFTQFQSLLIDANYQCTANVDTSCCLLFYIVVLIFNFTSLWADTKCSFDFFSRYQCQKLTLNLEF